MKRILFLESKESFMYILDSLSRKFDEILYLTDYAIPRSDLTEELQVEYNLRIPESAYTRDVTKDSIPKIKVSNFNKVPWVKLKDVELEDDTCYFLVGKDVWYYLRDLHKCHIGLRSTNLDWQVPHLTPFSMGSSKFVLCHSLTDEYAKNHLTYFFDDEVMKETVKPLSNSKTLSNYNDIIRALDWSINQDKGVYFGLDYETDGLYAYDRYDDLVVIGVGLATLEYGFYLEFRYLTEDELLSVKSKYKEFLDIHSSHCIVFNIDFELRITRLFLGDWAIYEFIDADVWRIMYGDQIGYSKKLVPSNSKSGPNMVEIKVNRDQRWSLKYTAQKYLKVPSWDNEFEEIGTLLYPIFKGYGIDNIDDFLTIEPISNIIHGLVDKGLVSESEMSKRLKDLCKFKNYRSLESLQNLFPELDESLVTELDSYINGTQDKERILSHPNWKKFESTYPQFKDELRGLINNPRFHKNEFSLQPSELVGKYCILDSYYTLMIHCKNMDIDYFNKDTNTVADAPWLSTTKVVDIFNSNKVLGGILAMTGLYKSNSKRARYLDIEHRVRIFSNYISAVGFHSLTVMKNKLDPHPSEKDLHSLFIYGLKKNLNLNDYIRLSKELLKDLYLEGVDYNWNSRKAEEILGDYHTEVLDILLSFYPKGFNNASAYSRSVNIHKEIGALFMNIWESQGLDPEYKWEVCLPYYQSYSKIAKSQKILDELDTFSIKGLHINEILKLDSFSFIKDSELRTYKFDESGLSVMKKEFFDINSNNEIELGMLTELWKPYKVLLTLFSPFEFQDEIKSANIFDMSDDIDTKIVKFHAFMGNVLNNYEQPELPTWQSARDYAVTKGFSSELQNPDLSDMEIPIQVIAYINSVISADLNSKYGISKALMDQYFWFSSIDEEMIKTKKAWLLDAKHASPMSYKNWMQEASVLGRLQDSLLYDDYNSMKTSNGFETCDLDCSTYLSYPKLATAFKMYRKYDKLGQYLTGQLVDSDHRLVGEGEDGVPKLSYLTPEDRHNNVAGDSVKMYPRYEIMQKFTKRNSSGIHTVPSRSEVKGVIIAPEDKLLVYTDISSMELRGIASISRDEVMLDYFEKGFDIYTEAAYAYHHDFLGKDRTKESIRKEFRTTYKTGVISTIYTAGDATLSEAYECKLHEVREIKNAIFTKFKRLYEWQQEQLNWNKLNRGFIKTFIGDIRKSYAQDHKQDKQAINSDVQGTCSLIATAGFKNIITSGLRKKMRILPAIIVHDAIIAYAMAKDIELLYDHYQDSFYQYLSDNYGFKFPFDLEIACSYFEKTTLSKGNGEREFNISGTNRAIRDVLTRVYNHGKRFEFLDEDISLDVINSRVNDKFNVIEQYVKSGGQGSFERDFSYGSYGIRFID